MNPDAIEVLGQMALDDIFGPGPQSENRLICWKDEWSDEEVRAILVGKNSKVDFDRFCRLVGRLPDSMVEFSGDLDGWLGGI